MLTPSLTTMSLTTNSFWLSWGRVSIPLISPLRLWCQYPKVLVTTGATILANLQSDRHHQQTNTQLLYRPDALPVAQPAVSKHWREDFITYLLLLIVEESGVSPCCGGTNSSPVDSMWSGRQCFNSDYSTHGIFATGKITAVLFVPSFFTWCLVVALTPSLSRGHVATIRQVICDACTEEEEDDVDDDDDDDDDVCWSWWMLKEKKTKKADTTFLVLCDKQPKIRKGEQLITNCGHWVTIYKLNGIRHLLFNGLVQYTEQSFDNMKIIKFQSYQSSVAKQADRNRILIVTSWFLFDLFFNCWLGHCWQKLLQNCIC